MRKSILLIAMLFLPQIVNAEITNQEEFITAIGGTEYAEIINDKITLKQDVVIKEEIITESGTYSIDLNGYTIKDDETSSFPRGNILFFKNSTVTIGNSKSTGGIETISESRMITMISGKLTVNNLIMNSGGTPVYSTSESLTVNGGEYTSSKSSGIYASSGKVELKDLKATGMIEGISLQSCDSTITNVTAIAKGEKEEKNNYHTYGLYIGLGTATINSGYFEGANAGVYIYGNGTIIKGGTYKATMNQNDDINHVTIGAMIHKLPNSEDSREEFMNMIDKELIIPHLTIYEKNDYELGGNVIYTNQEVELYYPKLTNTLTKTTNIGSSEVFKEKEYKTTLVADKYYELPKTITIKIGNKIITDGYIYDNKTGELTIDANMITDNVEIIAESTPIVVLPPETTDTITLSIIILIIAITNLFICPIYLKRIINN